VCDYWAEGRKWIDEKYQTIPFPFDEINAPKLSMKIKSSFSDYIGFLETWSATNTYLKQTGKNPIEQIIDQLKNVWGNLENIYELNWQICMRIGNNN
jgi:hypothetical protein